jgi:PKD repeat protein
MKIGTRITISFFIALLLLCAITTANAEIIAAHNVYRNEVGVAPLTYSSSLATSAQAWAEHDASIGSLVHSSGSYGENIASGMPTGSISWTDVVNLWGAEKTYFIYGPFGNECSTTGHWYDVGHYTQIIWSTTTQCGCGKATNVTQNTEYFVCQYSPPGNYWGNYPYPQVVSQPIASFTVNTTSGTAPLAVTFTDTSTGTGITAWNWSFGDGTWENRTTSTNPHHTYIAGTWYPRLTVTNTSGSNISLITPARTIIVMGVSASTKVGVYQNGAWYLDSSGNGSWDNGIDRASSFGAPGWMAVLGDWNGNSKTEIGVYQNGAWYLDNDGSGGWNTGDKAYSFGALGWTPVVGNWNGGTTGTKVGVYQNGAWYLDNDGSGGWNTGDKAYSFGAVGWTPVVGDWNLVVPGTKIGVYQNGKWYLDNDGSGTWNVGDKAYSFGASAWAPVIGDWNPAVPGDKIGVYKDGAWYLDWNGNGAWDQGTDKAYSFGATGWTPIIGDWNPSVAGTKIGVYQNGMWYIDMDGSGTWNAGDRANLFGTLGWTPVVGKWT